MNHYDVTIRETLEVKMKVAANSREEAEQFARDQWKRGEVVLDASHFTGVEFHALREDLIRAQELTDEARLLSRHRIDTMEQLNAYSTRPQSSWR